MAMADALNAEPATFFAQSNPQLPADLGQSCTQAVAEITALLQNTLEEIAPGTASLASVDFVANGTGVDAIYDVVSFEVAEDADGVVLIMRDRATSEILYSRSALTSPASRAARAGSAMTQAE